MDIPIFDTKILDNGTVIKHDGDTITLTNVRGHANLELTYRRGVGETWEVRMDVNAKLDGKHVTLYRSNATQEAIEFWMACGRKEFENDDAFRDAAYPKITAMLNKAKPKRAKK